MLDPASAFAHIEIAKGGPFNRGRIRLISDDYGDADTPDWYASLYRFPAPIREYAEGNRNSRNNPSIGGWPGPVWADRFTVDFDHGEEPERSLSDARDYANRLIAYGVPTGAIEAHFSGSKGFHVSVPGECFGDFDPSQVLPARHRRLFDHLAAGFSTADASIYTVTRLLRIENTRHGKTELYKVPLTFEELQGLTIEEIRKLAAAPRSVERPPVQPTRVLPLVDFWKGTERPDDTTPAAKGPGDGAEVDRLIGLTTRKGLYSHTKASPYGTVIVLNDCPVTRASDNPHEKDYGAYLTVFADGGAAYGCQHDRCRERGVSYADFVEAIGEAETGGGAHKRRGPRQSTGSSLWQAIQRSGATWFHDPKGIAYASIPLKGRTETTKIDSQRFKDWVISLALNGNGANIPGTNSIKEVIDAASAQARIDGETRTVYYRVGRADDGTIWLDLGEDDWTGVRVDADGWEILPLPSGLFRRTRGMLPLPKPEVGGSLDELRPFLNVEPETDFMLIVGWLIGAYRPDTGYPVLNLAGEQGTGKSDTARVLRRLIDPNATDLLSAPEGERNLWVAAENHWVMPLDNLSNVSKDLSNALCRLALGGGYGVRSLYTNDEEHAFSAARPLILTGIGDVATKGDLLDRSILVTLPMIGPERRRTEADLWQAFNDAQPRILGAVLGAISTAMRNLDSVQLSEMPRMADFAQWVEAAAPTLGWEPAAFAAAYRENLGVGHRIALESSSFGQALERFMAQRWEWSGNATELLNALTEQERDADSWGRTPDYARFWPKSPALVTKHVKELAPNLRASGIEAETGIRAAGGKKRLVRLRNLDYNDVDAKRAKDDPQPKARTRLAQSFAVSR